MSQVFQPLTRFHPNHGANVILDDDNTVAYRKTSFADAVAISEQPLNPGEIFLVEIEKTEPGWTGHMRLGLTQINPANPELPQLPPYSLPDMTNMGNSWICAITKSHNRVQPDTEAEPEPEPELDDGMEEDGEGGEDEVIGSPTENSTPHDRRASEGDVTRVTEGSGGGANGEHQGAGSKRKGRRRAMSNGKFTGLESFIVGDAIETSRGLVPLAALQPSPYVYSAPSGRKMTLKRDNILPTDEGSRIGIIYLTRGDLAEMHYIINGEDQGAFTKKLPYKEAPLYAVVDVYGTTKQVRIVQLYGVGSLKSKCRDIILKHIAEHGVNALPLPRKLKDYLLFVI
ncbi:neuralized-like protein 2 [Penaeus indicus]|uniref:neuralized-like protein 2 n=1 Tax=Penaeus indicus TaxID=29960 RepID=UPI00300D37A4